MKRIPFSRPYLISISLHLLFLLLLALWSIKVETSKRWYEFEWLSEEEYISSVDAGKAGDPIADAGILPIPQSSEASSTEQSEIIEQPIWDSVDNSSIDANPGAISSDISASLREAGTPQGSLSGGYTINLLEGGGDAYFIRETVPKITPLMDDTVIVEFSLNRDGRVNMNSVRVVSYRRAEHWRSLREAMQNWRFGFTGVYNPAQSYRISCKFTLK